MRSTRPGRASRPRRGWPRRCGTARPGCGKCAGDALWHPEAHPVLLRAGESLATGEVSGPAAAYWLSLLDTAARVLGPEHAQTLLCRDGLAASYEQAGRLDDAIAVHQRTLAERQQVLGNDHPDTLASCGYLARVYAAAGRHSDALPQYERVVADREWVLGARHPDTLAARSDLAAAYLAAGRQDQALPLYEQTLADLERGLGRPIRTRSPPGPGWPRPTTPRASSSRPSRCTSGPWPTGSGPRARTTRTRSAPGPTWPTPTGPRAG